MKKPILALVICTITYILFRFIPLFNKTNNILLLLSLISSSLFMTMLIGFMVISTLPIIILRKSDEVNLTSKHIPIIVLIIFIIFVFNLNYTSIYEKYTINSKKIYGIEMTFRALGDIVSNKTIEIKTNNWKIIHDQRFRYKRSGYLYDHYLEINEGEYIIPIGNPTQVSSLLYQSSYGGKSNNTITVCKNSKIIKKINGVDLSAKDNELYEFVNNKQYKIEIVLQSDNKITYQTLGCTVDEFIRNENVYLNIFDKNDKFVFAKKIKVGTDELPVFSADGKYSAYICPSIMSYKKISNSIVYEIKNGKIYKAEQQN